MDYRRFNIELREAVGLNCTESFFRRPVFAMVLIVGAGTNSSALPSRQKTSVGKYIGKKLTWNGANGCSSMRFYVEDSKLQQNRLVLVVQLRRKRILGISDKVIGEVYVPLKELYDNCGGISIGIGMESTNNYRYHQLASPSSGKLKPRGLLHYRYGFGDLQVQNDVGAVADSRATPSAPSLDYLDLNY